LSADLPRGLAAVAFIPGADNQVVAAGTAGVVLLDLNSGKQQPLIVPLLEADR
jgi:hypothetical protein